MECNNADAFAEPLWSCEAPRVCPSKQGRKEGGGYPERGSAEGEATGPAPLMPLAIMLSHE